MDDLERIKAAIYAKRKKRQRALAEEIARSVRYDNVIPEWHRKARKQAFIDELARFLVGAQAVKCVALECGLPWAREWAALRQATPLAGHCTQTEAVRILEEFLL